MVVICNIYKDIDNLLSHFLQHYYNLGIRDFYFGIHSGESNPVWNRIESFDKWNLKIKKWKSYDGPINGVEEGNSERFLRSQVPEGGWYIPTDLDEFHLIEGYSSFKDLIDDCIKEESDFVYGYMIDRVASDFLIPPMIKPDVPIELQFSQKMKITKSLLKAWDRKVILTKQSVVLNDGHHFPIDLEKPDFKLKTFSKMLEINHYKWFGNLRQKEQEKLESYKKSGLEYYLENQRLLDFLDKNNERLSDS